MHQPRDVGLQRMCTCGRVLRLAGVTPSDLKEKEKVRKEENERKMGKETEDAPPMVLFGLKFSRKDDPGSSRHFWRKLACISNVFASLPFCPWKIPLPLCSSILGLQFKGCFAPQGAGSRFYRIGGSRPTPSEWRLSLRPSGVSINFLSVGGFG